jgi:hypothetical protein
MANFVMANFVIAQILASRYLFPTTYELFNFIQSCSAVALADLGH